MHVNATLSNANNRNVCGQKFIICVVECDVLQFNHPHLCVFGVSYYYHASHYCFDQHQLNIHNGCFKVFYAIAYFWNVCSKIHTVFRSLKNLFMMNISWYKRKTVLIHSDQQTFQEPSEYLIEWWKEFVPSTEENSAN